MSDISSEKTLPESIPVGPDLMLVYTREDLVTMLTRTTQVGDVIESPKCASAVAFLNGILNDNVDPTNALVVIQVPTKSKTVNTPFDEDEPISAKGDIITDYNIFNRKILAILKTDPKHSAICEKIFAPRIDGVIVQLTEEEYETIYNLFSLSMAGELHYFVRQDEVETIHSLAGSLYGYRYGNDIRDIEFLTTLVTSNDTGTLTTQVISSTTA